MNSRTIPVIATTILNAAHQTVVATHLGPATYVSRSTTTRNGGQIAKITINNCTVAGLLRIVDLANWTNDGVTTTDTVWTCEVPVGLTEVTYDFPIDANAGIVFGNGLGVLSGAVDNIAAAVASVSISWVS